MRFWRYFIFFFQFFASWPSSLTLLNYIGKRMPHTQYNQLFYNLCNQLKALPNIILLKSRVLSQLSGVRLGAEVRVRAAKANVLSSTFRTWCVRWSWPYDLFDFLTSEGRTLKKLTKFYCFIIYVHIDNVNY